MSVLNDELRYSLAKVVKNKFDFAYDATAAPVGRVYKAELYEDQFLWLADDLIKEMKAVLNRHALAALLGDLDNGKS